MSNLEIFQAVKLNMLSMMKYSKIEFNEFKKTGKVVYLQQAGEKLFNATENYIQYVQKQRHESFYELQKSVREKPLRQLLYDMKRLHQFFYNGELDFQVDYIEDEYIRLSSILEARIKKL